MKARMVHQPTPPPQKENLELMVPKNGSNWLQKNWIVHLTKANLGSLELFFLPLKSYFDYFG